MKESKAPRIVLPVIGYKIEIPEMLQSILMISVGLSAIPVLQEYLGMSYGQALTSVAIAEALGVLHVTFGDPVVPGWIASALSLVMVYLSGFGEATPESIYAMMALQILVGALFLVLGFTGLAHKMMEVIPIPLKSGIILGAGIHALSRVFSPEGYFFQYPVALGSGIAVTLIVLYSMHFRKWKEKIGMLQAIAKYGSLPGLIVAYIIGVVVGEVEVPQIEWGIIDFDFVDMAKDFSVFAVGFPSAMYFIKAFPTAISVYIIAFGEVVTADAIIDECKKARPEDPLHFSANKTNIIAGIRNMILAFLCPFVNLAGPLWAAVSVSVGERYKDGKSMKTLYGGMGTFKLSTAVCVFFLPVACLCKPILPVALAITLAVQGFACSYIAIDQAKSDRVTAGIAGVIGAIIFILGLNEGLIIGLILCITMVEDPFNIKRNREARKRREAEEENTEN